MVVEHFFSDMDSTLLGSDNGIPQHNIDIIKNVDIPFTLVSARAPVEMDFAIDTLDLKGPQIGFNGGIIYEGTGNNRKVMQKKPIGFHVAKSLVESVCKKFPDISLSFYDENHWYAEGIDNGIELESAITGQTPTIVNFHNLLQGNLDVYKIMIVIFDEETMQSLIQYLNNKGEETVVIQRSGKNHLEITNSQAIKANGIKYVLATEHIDVESIYAFGDGHNDIPTFELVGHPVAMDNAVADLKRHAEFITGNNDDGGVGEFIKKLV